MELAKAGFRTDQAISATRASLQLASAAGVNAADSARYLGDIMDQFGLGADQAARASDILCRHREQRLRRHHRHLLRHAVRRASRRPASA